MIRVKKSINFAIVVLTTMTQLSCMSLDVKNEAIDEIKQPLKFHARTILQTKEMRSLRKEALFINSLTVHNKTYLLDLDYTRDGLLNTEVCIGTPKQCFDVILDTGSYVLWVASHECVGSQCPTDRYYDYKSKTAKKSSVTKTIQYATGMTSGFVYTDKVSLDKKTSPVDMAFISAYVAKFSADDSHGILGLGRNYKSKFGYNNSSILEELYKGSVIHKRVFSVKWTSYWDGEFTIGEYPYELYALPGNFTKCKISDLYRPKPGEHEDIYWSCNASSFVRGENNSTNITLFNTHTFSVVFDTGSNGLLAPISDLESILVNYFDFIKGTCHVAATNVVDKSAKVIICKEDIDVSNLPEFGFIINENYFSIPGRSIFKKISGLPDSYIYLFNVVFSNITSYWLLGTPFLKHYHTVYDMDKLEVHFQKNTLNLEKPPYQYFYVYIAVVGVCVLIIVLFLLLLVRSCRKKRIVRESNLSNKSAPLGAMVTMNTSPQQDFALNLVDKY